MRGELTAARRRLVLEYLASGERSSRDIKGHMIDNNVMLSQPNYSVFMKRMERSGLIVGRNVKTSSRGIPFRVRWYRLAGADAS